MRAFDISISFIERCERHEEMPALVRDFSSTLALFGFKYFMMTRLPAMGEDAEPYVIAHTWPKFWLDRYREAHYFWHDPVSAFSMSRARPFTWQEAREGSRPTVIAGKIAAEAGALGLVDGIGFPMGDASSVQAVVSLASDLPVVLDSPSRQMLHLVCINAEMRAVEIHDRISMDFGTLTEREREVLRWIANGKSYDETGAILSISDRTVKEHLTHSREKMNASTTTHAVARAIKSKQITL